MILQKEFYFVRHGQTDYNVLEGKNKGDHPEEIPLNATGREQAKEIEPLIAALPVEIVCASPLKRVQETKELITPRLQVRHHEFAELGECSAQIWREMAERGMYSSFPEEGMARHFMERVRAGINHVLSLPGAALVVAHGGVHWAICCLMGIEEHTWAIGNCVPVHFSLSDRGKWTARIIVEKNSP